MPLVVDTARSSGEESKLMSYKDEYEVARLYTNGDFIERLRQQFDGDYKLHFHMAPPILSKPGKPGGEPRKIEVGGWMFGALKVLARMKGLRGGMLDPFGKTAERKMERRLIDEYEELVSSLLPKLNAESQTQVETLAALPEMVKGYGPIKERNVESYEVEKLRLLKELETKPSPVARIVKIAAA